MRQAVFVLALTLLAPYSALAVDPPHEDLAPLDETEESLLRASLGRIHTIRAPLLARPAFAPSGGSFLAEVEVDAGVALGEFRLVRGTQIECALVATAVGAGRSRAWPDMPDLQVARVRLDVGAGCAPGLYDLHRVGPGPLGEMEERQVHAVRVMDRARYDALARGEAHPRIVVIADPQVGDPRALAQTLEEGRPERIPAILDGLVGDGGATRDGRWKAVRVALAQARALDPDFVLIAGDLGFGQLVPGSYAAEYEEIWRVLAAADVPLFVAPGNHDGYVANGQDGFAYWHAYIGPLYTLAPSVPGTSVLILNTYDWSDMDRLGVSYGVSAWGGQLREAQLAWLEDALEGASRTGDRILSVSHHSPGWRQDPWSPTFENVPVAEQVERGALTYTSTDQGWIGRNRLEVRDLLREHGVEVHFAGHTHHDRIARDDGAGRIVGTQQTLKGMPEDFDPRLLHFWDRNDAPIEGFSQEDLADLVRMPTGPLYVDTTTAMSDTEQYWGYRPVEIAYDSQGLLDLARIGYPLAQEELDALALHPERYNVEHAALGLFSTPLELELGEPWSHLPASG